VRPLLVGCALVLALAVLSRFPPLGLAAPVPSLIAAVVGLVLGLVGASDRQLPRGSTGPLWMRLSTPLTLCLALGFSYFTTVFAQELGVSLGPADPSFPGKTSERLNTVWFVVFTLGFVGVGRMSAPALLVPLLRVVTSPTSRLRGVPALVVGALCGLVFTVLFVAGLHAPPTLEVIARAKTWFDQNATLGTLVLVAIGVVPNLLPSKGD
jgi:hypothetical protein